MLHKDRTLATIRSVPVAAGNSNTNTNDNNSVNNTLSVNHFVNLLQVAYRNKVVPLTKFYCSVFTTGDSQNAKECAVHKGNRISLHKIIIHQILNCTFYRTDFTLCTPARIRAPISCRIRASKYFFKVISA